MDWLGPDGRRIRQLHEQRSRGRLVTPKLGDLRLKLLENPQLVIKEMEVPHFLRYENRRAPENKG